MPHANSMTSSPRWTSPRASESTLPCSLVIISASSSTLALTSSRKANSTFARVLSDDCDQSAKAACALATAVCTSAAEPSSTWAVCSPVAGSNTGPVRVESSAVALPSTQCSIVRMSAPRSGPPAGRALSMASRLAQRLSRTARSCERCR